MQPFLALTLAALVTSAQAAPQAFHDAVRGTFAKLVPTRPLGEDYILAGGLALVEYDEKGQTITVSGPITNGPVVPVALWAPGKLSGMWCGVKDTGAAVAAFMDWYMVGLQRYGARQRGERASSLVTARLGTCKALLLTEGGGDAVMLLKRVPGPTVWPPRLAD